MMHGVDEVSFKLITTKALGGIIAYLAEYRDTIWTESYGTVGRYIKERTLADAKFKDVTTAGFDVRFELPKYIEKRDCMTVPLTVKIALNAHNRDLVKVCRGDLVVPTAHSHDGKILLVDMVPDGTWVWVVWGESSES